MSRFKNIVGNILHEFTDAQHAANLHAARLGREYAENDMLQYFMIPNACANELDFTLKFAVQSTDQTETVSEINFQRLVLFFSQLSISIAETVITTTIYTVEGFVAKDTDSFRELKEKEELLRRDFCDFLAKKLRITFLKKGVNEVDEEGFIVYGNIFEMAMDVINQEFFNHPQLKFSGKQGNKELSVEVKESCSSFVETLIQHACKDINLLEEKENQILDIILDTESLSKIAPENIQQIHFKVSLRNYQVSPSEIDGEVIDQIIPANI